MIYNNGFGGRNNDLEEALKDKERYKNIENAGSVALRLGFLGVIIVLGILAILGLINLFQMIIV